MTSDEKKLGLIGSPISHSLSPEIFHFLARHFNVKCRYDLVEISSEKEFFSYLETAQSESLYDGFNVTTPWKKQAYDFSSYASSTAEHLKASNHLSIQSNKTIAQNTDVIGVRRALLEMSDSWSGGSAVLLGAGGAARAVAHAIKELGFSQITVLNRNLQNAKTLCDEIWGEDSGNALPLCFDQISRVRQSCDLVVNTLASSVYQAAFEVLDWKPCVSRFAMDLDYRDEETSFIKDMKSLGVVCKNGLDMLIWQALEGFRIWFDLKESDVNSLKELTKDHLLRFIQSKDHKVKNDRFISPSDLKKVSIL